MTHEEFFNLLINCYDDIKRFEFIEQLDFTTYKNFILYLYDTKKHFLIKEIFLPENEISIKELNLIDIINKPSGAFITSGSNNTGCKTYRYSINEMLKKLEFIKIKNKELELKILKSDFPIELKKIKNRL